MDEREHEDYLTGIAKEVGELIVKQANLKRFRQQDRIFWELCKVYCQAVEQERQAAESNPRLRNKKAGPPTKDHIWYNQERSQKFYPEGYWRRSEKALPLNPVDLLSFPKDDITEFMFPPQAPKHPIEKLLLAYYAFFTVLHDHYRVDDIKINNGIWPEDEDWVRGKLEEISWKHFKELGAGNRLRAYIDLALDHVKADLPEKPAETGQKEIVEVKPGAFGITVNIKEIAKRIWKRVCSRSKD